MNIIRDMLNSLTSEEKEVCVSTVTLVVITGAMVTAFFLGTVLAKTIVAISGISIIVGTCLLFQSEEL